MTSTSGQAIYIEDGQQVYPCRCGEIHRGDYACEQWNHHECFHRSPLVDISAPDLPLRSYLICMDCGEVFYVDVDAPAAGTAKERIGD